MSAAFVTIVTPCHFAFANVALRSIECSDQCLKIIYIIGAKKGQLFKAFEGVSINYVEDCLDQKLISALIKKYKSGEICFVLKPFVILDLMSRGSRSVHYIDADLRFYSKPNILNEELKCHDILLTPHYLKKFPLDLFKPNVLTLLRAGIFNAGYVGVKKSDIGLSFLKWWSENVMTYGHNSPQKGMCGDQRWLDLVPVLFPDCKILRYPSLNVAYWNLHERSLSVENGTIMCEKERLIFFHFSGFNVIHPNKLSKYQNRIQIQHGSELNSLLVEYAEEVISAGHLFYSKYVYAYSKKTFIEWVNSKGKSLRSVS